MSKPTRKTPRRVTHSTQVTFTVRDLNRQTASVLETCDATGSVRIQSRDGRTYSLTPESPEPARSPIVIDFMERRRRLREKLLAMGYVGPSAADMELINRIISGEQ